MDTRIIESRITEDERDELLHSLGRRVREFTILHEVAQIAIESLDLDEVLSKSLDKVIASMAVETAVILLTNEANGEVIAAARGGLSPKFLDKLREPLVGNKIAGRVTLSGVPVVIEDVSKYPQLADTAVRQEGLRSIAALALKSGSGVIGTLIVASHNLHSFSSEDIQLLSVISEGLGATLKNAQLYKALQEKTRQLVAQNKELVARGRELKEKTMEAEEASWFKSQFLATMSHELRTPLNIIIGFSELMQDEAPGPVNQGQRQCLDDIMLSGRHLLGIIDEVLDLARIESGKMKLSMTDVNLSGVIESLRNIMMPVLAPGKQSLDVAVDKGLCRVYADEGRIRQVLLNLLSNAAKFTPEGGKLRVEVVRRGDWCQVSVIDNGIGIKREDQHRIFEPFYQLDSHLTKEKNGIGLGLTVAKQIVDKHGGQIWVESEYGQGSRFIFTLPRSDAGSPYVEEINQ
jgi:signal transduction histidine kinase